MGGPLQAIVFVGKAQMYIHIQNRLENAFLPVTAEIVAAVAAERKNDRFTVGNSDARFAEAITTAEILVTTADQLQLRFPCSAPKLKGVFLTHAGIDRLIANNPLPPNMLLMNNSGAHSRKAGEYVLMATLMLRAGMPGFIANQHRHHWQPVFSPTLAGCRITMVGVGGLGAAAARALRPFGVHLTGIRHGDHPHPDFDITASVTQLDAVLPQTDVLVLAAPLTSATRGLIGEPQLQRWLVEQFAATDVDE